MMVVVRHHGQEKKLPLLIVPGDGASLLGRDWMGKFWVDWREVHKLHSLKVPTDPFAWFEELFGDDNERCGGIHPCETRCHAGVLQGENCSILDEKES